MNFFKEIKSGREGFTLIEMLVVVGIIGVLASLVLVGLGPSRTASRDVKRISNVNQLRNLLEVYYLKNSKYPDSLSEATLLGYNKVVGTEKTEQERYGYTGGGSSYTIGVNTEGDQKGSVTTGEAGIVKCETDYCVSSD
ncbi:MAG: hypothetical protein A2390_01180 [Candidatus Liptonbacteria bacterium RIFOXYB1_FULL_36_10]|uniref:Type II secretion system protein GspG C-terminal domain-containing protein n=2 Tax=Candidatus Liptoniibacteriota TaxID=1817909 RepID=A0A1G2CQF8_9BACT|nr:MAG: hypothetical protein A2390_01180 [Candidatus Liptonbacteria bacterium RIFOXYB1_FULL_36_10]OGZ03669.1 MAG: hypothetical protein A2604_01820 [Candidatus Liptonbacteria bacterium RIFOXYD1_FULL_36_11]